MKLGLALPTAGPSAGVDAIVRAARESERIGLDSIWAFERLLSPTGEVAFGEQVMTMPAEFDTVYSPLEVLSFVAANTQRITLGTSVLLPLLHNPAALGRSLATLDQLSRGRVVAGLGQGWLRQEFEAADIPMSRRGAGFEEFIAAMQAVWAPDPVGFTGRFYAIHESNVGPKPSQVGGLPLLVGAASPVALNRAGRLGLGIIPHWLGWDMAISTIATFRAAAEAAGHDPAGLPVVLRVHGALTQAAAGTEPTLTGSPEQAADAFPRLEELGVSEVTWAMQTPIEEQLDRMRQLVAPT
jgi:probable F420-dependent oxidoreductase